MKVIISKLNPGYNYVAARRYLDDLDGESTTAQIDDALADGVSDDSTTVAVVAGRDRLAAQDDW